MDSLDPQMQNPNVPPAMSAGPTPSMPSIPKIPRKNKSLFWLVLVIIVVVGVAVWWYIGQMVPESVVQQQPQIDQEAREDALISNDIEGNDLGDLDAEFEDIDKDLNSL